MQSALASLKCPFGYQVKTICSSLKCEHSASCCEEQNCKCSLNHETCNLLRYKNIYKKLLSKIVPHEQLLKYVANLFDDIIDEISKIRQDTQEVIKYFGLKVSQIKVLKAIQKNQTNNLKGKDVLLACQSSDIQKFEYKPQKTKQIIQNLWQQCCHLTLTPFFQIKDICERPSLSKFNKNKQQKNQIEKNKLRKQRSVFDQHKQKQKIQNQQQPITQKLYKKSLKWHPLLKQQEDEQQIQFVKKNIEKREKLQQRLLQKQNNNENIQVQNKNQGVKQIKKLTNEKQEQKVDEIKAQNTKSQQLQNIFGLSQIQTNKFIDLWEDKFKRELSIQQICEIYFLGVQN